MSKPEYIQLEKNDDVPHVRDLLSFIRGKRVLLIWPEEGTALTRKLDLVLIQREAKRRAIQLAIVTHDITVIQHAQDLNISTFNTVGESERERWKRGRTKVFTQRHHKPQDEPDPQELLPIASRVRTKRPQLNAWQTFLLRLAVLAFLIFVTGITLYAVYPSATVIITLQPEQLTTSMALIADPSLADVNVESATIPATTLRVDVQTSGTITTTGITSLGNDNAIGIVVFTNKGESPVEIPINTSVSTSAGTPILFKTIATITVPAGIGARAEVGIEALQSSSGAIGNVETGMINVVVGPLDSQVSVRNLSPTTGGATRDFASVTQEDKDRLLGIVRGQLQAVAYSEMQARLTDSQVIVIETIRITEERNDWTTFSHSVGEMTDTLSLTMKAIVTALAIDDRYGRQLVFAQLSAQKPSGKLLQADTFVYMRGNVTDISPTNRITFTANGEVSAIAQVNLANLQERLAGMPIDESELLIRQFARLTPQDSVIIRTSVPELPHLPLLPIRIAITIQSGTTTLETNP